MQYSLSGVFADSFCVFLCFLETKHGMRTFFLCVETFVLLQISRLSTHQLPALINVYPSFQTSIRWNEVSVNLLMAANTGLKDAECELGEHPGSIAIEEKVLLPVFLIRSQAAAHIWIYIQGVS